MKNLILLFTFLITTISFSQTENQVNREETRTVDDYEKIDQVVIDYDKEVFIAGKVEVNPEYPGGEKAVFAFLEKKIKISKEILEQQGSQKVFAQFIIEKNGRLSDIKVLRSNSPELTKEFTKALKAMKWTPAKQNNRIVRSSYMLPFQAK
ncbi:protein TonB [Flavobacterium sp. 2755]|uniref:energy transducer TonB n=1 Tax=Flavobacterium sp. 2755 TaxID=2817765 RepID=UPI002864B7A8|nr:energy transducer TonB [Flavobacterium sp. 2755]MDR6764488.1 protein TonB [Flavobacterium sp. 2755]